LAKVAPYTAISGIQIHGMAGFTQNIKIRRTIPMCVRPASAIVAEVSRRCVLVTHQIVRQRARPCLCIVTCIFGSLTLPVAEKRLDVERLGITDTGLELAHSDFFGLHSQILVPSL
jgi:hypothetical protein